MSELFVAFLCGSVGGGLVALAVKWTLARNLSQLNLRMTDFEERLYVEMKKRASRASQSHKEFEQQLFADAASKNTQPQVAQPWYLQHVSPDLLKH